MRVCSSTLSSLLRKCHNWAHVDSFVGPRVHVNCRHVCRSSATTNYWAYKVWTFDPNRAFLGCTKQNKFWTCFVLYNWGRPYWGRKFLLTWNSISLAFYAQEFAPLPVCNVLNLHIHHRRARIILLGKWIWWIFQKFLNCQIPNPGILETKPIFNESLGLNCRRNCFIQVYCNLTAKYGMKPRMLLRALFWATTWRAPPRYLAAARSKWLSLRIYSLIGRA